MKKRLMCVLIALLLLCSSLILRFTQHYTVASDTYAQQAIKGTLSKEINRIITVELTKYELTYNEIADISYSNDGQIGAIVINTVQLNMIANRLSEKIYDCVENSTHKFGIPIGNALGSRLFSGKGPEIGVEIIPIGFVDYSIRSELADSGINQTLHRICIDFRVDLKCLSPFYETEINVNTSIIITETLIVGKVPEIMLSSWG